MKTFLRARPTMCLSNQQANPNDIEFQIQMNTTYPNMVGTDTIILKTKIVMIIHVEKVTDYFSDDQLLS